jgi:hypothetical protein
MIGARDWLNQHPKVAFAGGCVFVLAAIGMIAGYVMASRHRFPAGPPEAYFTTDDGQTYFAAGDDNFPPFDHGGVPAVKAYVFQCGGQKFVGYLERFDSKTHDYVVAHGLTPEALRFGREVKRPGEPKWQPTGDSRNEAKLTEVRCPSGGTEEPEPIAP